METRMELLRQVFQEQEEQEALLRWRNPGFDVVYNWLVAGLVVALFVSFALWGRDAWEVARELKIRSEVYAEMEAEQAEEDQKRKEAEEAMMQADAALQISEAKAIARAWFGIRNFTSKYGYTNEDLITYAYCPVNRAEATGKSIEEVLAEEGQFIAYSDKNDLETKYYDLALQFVADLHAGKLKPCDTKFRYAVLKDTGIWLVDDPGKDVPERWHA